jgi:hypothetical protein
MLPEVRVTGEVIVLAMFEDKDAFLLQQSFFENKVGNSRQFL